MDQTAKTISQEAERSNMGDGRKLLRWAAQIDLELDVLVQSS